MLAIIPARGGSKGIPGKNIRLLCGKPLIAYTIEAVLASVLIDRIIISTDDPKIAEVARQYDVEIPFMRPKELAKDDSLAIDNYIYTIDRLNKEFDNNYEEFVVLLPTVPLRLSEDIDKAIELFHNKNAESVISCAEVGHPLEWICSINDHGVIQRSNDVDIKKMMNRQESQAGYIPNGAIFVFKHSLLKEKCSYYSDKTYAYVMPPERSIDIDTESDFEFVEFLMRKRDFNA
ncbi:MAG: acylneuraminate cytidylyltransferase family protein [Candidatus Scalindua sediminis]|nr:acylneuraminate cytidylyltransferase family protein [Candidatus Scalindua sediminis]